MTHQNDPEAQRLADIQQQKIQRAAIARVMDNPTCTCDNGWTTDADGNRCECWQCAAGEAAYKRGNMVAMDALQETEDHERQDMIIENEQDSAEDMRQVVLYYLYIHNYQHQNPQRAMRQATRSQPAVLSNEARQVNHLRHKASSPILRKTVTAEEWDFLAAHGITRNEVQSLDWRDTGNQNWLAHQRARARRRQGL